MQALVERFLEQDDALSAALVLDGSLRDLEALDFMPSADVDIATEEGCDGAASAEASSSVPYSSSASASASKTTDSKVDPGAGLKAAKSLLQQLLSSLTPQELRTVMAARSGASPTARRGGPGQITLRVLAKEFTEALGAHGLGGRGRASRLEQWSRGQPITPFR